MNSVQQRTLAIAIFFVLGAAAGCKQRGGSASSSAASSQVTSDGVNATAVSAGAVNVTGNVVTYQNVHIHVPWNAPDPTTLVKLSQDAASGAALKLTDGKNTLIVASDGHSIRLNGQACGPVKPGDTVVLTNDGKLTVNTTPRLPEASATRPT